MTIGLFSDIHANLPALEAVLEALDERRPDMLFCLGDLVGYAPWPNEVVGLVRERSIPTIVGNYDEGVGLNSDDCGCAYRTDRERELGARSIAYANETVTDETRAYLRELPRHVRLTFAGVEVLMVHGSPRRINEYLVEERPDQSFSRMMERAGADIMLFGHTHKPFHKIIPTTSDSETRYRHAVNIGSVGKPKDGDPRTCCVLLTVPSAASAAHPNGIDVEFVRTEYDVEKAARAVQESPLPDEYADMLRTAS